MLLLNRTPYVAERVVALDKNGGEILVVAVKGTWRFSERGGLELADEQVPLAPKDEYSGEPGMSSVIQESELGLPKPSSNVALLGSAFSARRVRELIVSLRVGPVAKSVRAVGRRRWWSLFGFPRATRPEPFESISLKWENAYGGTDAKAKSWEPRNPVGRGYRGKKSKLAWKGTDLPNLEHPRTPVRKPGGRYPPAGFGFIAPFWEPRRSRAGTYDERWMDRRAPLLPEDFQNAFHNSVPDDQVAGERLGGGEPIEVRGAGPWGRLRSEVPREFPVATVAFDRSIEGLPLLLDTLTIETDAAQLRVVWKGALPVHRRLFRLREIDLRLAGGRGRSG